ncbi:MAG: roadblock/LC7 domain-containing protein [Deltaproteobacteria bacterium]|nr:roadblock/LC7 domain-containing protein [Deltaproteobacteria bacterium]
MSPPMVMHDDEFRQISQICEALCKDANARVVFVIDKNGQLLAASGEADRFDSTSLASLVAGEMAATGGIAKLIGEKDFSVLFHEGTKDNLHITLVGGRVILVVIFDKRSNLGLVRLRVKRHGDELGKVFDELLKRSQIPGAGQPFAEITDEDIDNLFPE